MARAEAVPGDKHSNNRHIEKFFTAIADLLHTLSMGERAKVIGSKPLLASQPRLLVF
jgi:hypothetical protein